MAAQSFQRSPRPRSRAPLHLEHLETRNLLSGGYVLYDEILPGALIERIQEEPLLLAPSAAPGEAPQLNLGAPPLISLKKGPNLLANSAASAAFDQAAALVSDLFNDNVTVVIDAEVASLGSGILRSTGSTGLVGGYDVIRTPMISDRNTTTEAIVAALPTLGQFTALLPNTPSNPFSLNASIGINRANAKAIGFSDASLPGPASAYDASVIRDMTMTFSTNFAFDYDRSDGIAVGQFDFVGVAVHEIMHGLGFVSTVDTVDFMLGTSASPRIVYPTTLDMFRLQPGAGAASFSTSPRVLSTGSTVPQQVIYDGGRHNFTAAAFTNITVGDIPVSTAVNNGDGRQGSHWKDDALLPGGLRIGIMDPNVGSATRFDALSADVMALGLIGWDVAEDFGDAPAPYPTTGATAAQHQIVTAVYLGTIADDEIDGQPNAAATGDDVVATPDDEDGITLPASITVNSTASITVSASKAGFLNGWVDFNDDGDWADGDEHIFTDQALALGNNTLTFNVPAGATITPQTFARFRYTTYNTAGALGVTGLALDGEVEDYQLAITSPANLAPTLDSIPNPFPVLEDPVLQTVSLTGITAGSGETQTLTVTATSNDASLIPNPAVTFTSPNNTGSLSYIPIPNANGSATITVTVQDNGGTANGGVDTTTRTFTVTVIPVNDQPIQAPIPDPTAILEDAGFQTVGVSGMVPGPANESSQTLTMTAISDDTSLIPNPTVTYTSPETTGSQTYTPVANAFGTAVITVTIQDNGGTENGGVDTFIQFFAVAVTPVNDTPTLASVPDLAAILEGDGDQTVSLSGITAGPGNESSQALTVTATSNNTSLIPNPTINYTSSSTTGSLSYTPVVDANGTATITVTVQDNGGTDNGGVDTTTRTFTVTVTAVNDAPTLASIANPAAIPEDSGTQAVGLSGITSGLANESSQTLTVTATSNNPTVIPNPTVTYASPNTTGSLSYTPVADASGTATITVTVQDDGGTANGGVDSTSRTFIVTVNAVNDQPTLNPLAAVIRNEDAPPLTVSLTGIRAGGGESQTLSVTAVSSNPALVPDPTVTYTSANSVGTLTLTPIADANSAVNGTATITVTVNDGQPLDNTVTQSFLVTINPANDTPTLDPLNPVPLSEDAAAQTVNLSGITSGAANETQILTVTATSNNTALIPNPTVSYTSAASTGTLTFQPLANRSGSATLTVTVNDGQGLNNITTKSFLVIVAPVNDAPTINNINSITLNEDAPPRTVNLSGISAGGGEIQALIVTATSSNPALIPNPTVNYTSANTTGSLTFQPAADASGVATITVTVNDGQPLSNLASRSFQVTINAVNDQPTLDPLNPALLNEDAGAQTVSLSGISAGGGETQALTVTSVSNKIAVIPNPTITYTSADSTGTLTYLPVTNANTAAVGPVTINVTVNDGGASHNTVSKSFQVTITAVNDAPTLNALNPQTVNEDGPAKTIGLSGITAGHANEAGQVLTVTALSSDPSILPNPTVNYTSANTTGTLTFQPLANAYGQATVSVTVNDGSPSNNTMTRTFSVTVNAINDQPTLEALPNVVLDVNASTQSVNLLGISAGPNESQPLTVTAASNNAALVPNPTITYTSPDASGTLNFTPATDEIGTATITVTVNDGAAANNTVIRTFTVTVNPL